MFLKSVALFVNVYLQFGFVQAQLNVVFEQYIGVDLRNIEQLRERLFNDANAAIRNARRELVGNRYEPVDFVVNDQKHFTFRFYNLNQAGNIHQNAEGHPIDASIYGNGVIPTMISITWKNNREKIEYKETTALNLLNKTVIFKQEIVYTGRAIITILQSNIHNYKIDN